MSEIYFFAAFFALFVASITFVVYRIGGIRPTIAYAKTKDGNGIIAGIFYFLLFGALFVIGASIVKADDIDEVKYFDYGKVYIGIDNTTQPSPQCDSGRVSNKVTSNGGLIINLIKADRFEFNAKYTHHSCAFNPDRESYDAVGVSIEYRLW